MDKPGKRLFDTPPDEHRACKDCGQLFPIDEFGCLIVPYFDINSRNCDKCGTPYEVTIEDNRIHIHHSCSTGVMVGSLSLFYGGSTNYCPYCHEARRKKNRQAYPLCQICSKPARASDFLKYYQGYQLCFIRVCCKQCSAYFHSLPEQEQVQLINKAALAYYKSPSYIYALVEPRDRSVHKVGRTYNPNSRLSETIRNSHHSSFPMRRVYDWIQELDDIGLKPDMQILETVLYGPSSIERELRWMLYGHYSRWPLHNLEHEGVYYWPYVASNSVDSEAHRYTEDYEQDLQRYLEYSQEQLEQYWLENQQRPKEERVYLGNKKSWLDDRLQHYKESYIEHRVPYDLMQRITKQEVNPLTATYEDLALLLRAPGINIVHHVLEPYISKQDAIL